MWLGSASYSVVQRHMLFGHHPVQSRRGPALCEWLVPFLLSRSAGSSGLGSDILCRLQECERVSGPGAVNSRLMTSLLTGDSTRPWLLQLSGRQSVEATPQEVTGLRSQKNPQVHAQNPVAANRPFTRAREKHRKTPCTAHHYFVSSVFADRCGRTFPDFPSSSFHGRSCGNLVRSCPQHPVTERIRSELHGFQRKVRQHPRQFHVWTCNFPAFHDL